MSYTRIDIIEPCYHEFGEWLAGQRKKLGLLQADVAPLIGVSRASIANIEGGNQRVLLHQYLLLKEAMQSNQTFATAIEGAKRAAEDMIILRAEQIRRQRGEAQTDA
jgi:DNA-binding XRE family transcriptional regulator